MEQAAHQELCRLYDLAARLLLLPDGSDPTGAAAHGISLGGAAGAAGAVGGRSSGSGDTSPSMAMLALRRLSRETEEEDGEDEEEACLLAPPAAAARSKPAAPVAVAEKAVAAKRRRAEAAADGEGAAKPPSPLAFTSSGRVRTAPQRLDASLLAASLYGKNGSAGKNKKAAVAAAEEKAKEGEAEAEEDGTALGQGKGEEEDSEEEEEEEEEACSTCGGVHTSESNAMLLCDGPGCEQAFHQQCLVPPLQCVPEGDWLCPTCSTVKPATVTRATERPKPGAERTPVAKATAPQGDGLPDGWLCTTHGRPGGEQYKRYKGPNGLRSQSIRQAWVIHERALHAAEPTPPAGLVAVKPVAAKRRQAEAVAADEGAAVAFTSSGRMRTAPQRLDASVLAASQYGKHGSAREATTRKEAALQEEEDSEEEEEQEEDPPPTESEGWQLHVSSSSPTGYTGVVLAQGRFRAQLALGTFQSKAGIIGTYDTAVAAAVAYARAVAAGDGGGAASAEVQLKAPPVAGNRPKRAPLKAGGAAAPAAAAGALAAEVEAVGRAEAQRVKTAAEPQQQEQRLGAAEQLRPPAFALTDALRSRMRQPQRQSSLVRCPRLGGARARYLCLLMARLVALCGTKLPRGRWRGPLGAHPPPRVLVLAAPNPAKPTNVGPSGRASCCWRHNLEAQKQQA
jgi:hypothetical protein